MDSEASRLAFLDEVIDNPTEDDARLIYADWLEEQGNPRGEFIRVQCEMAQTNSLDPHYFDLLEQSEELLDEHRDEWAAELKQDVRKAVFHRGFIDTITVRARAFHKEAAELFRATPIHWLRLNYVKGMGDQLAAMEELSLIRHLDLSMLKVPKEDLVALLSSPNLSSLEGLNISHLGTVCDADLGRIIAKSAFASELRELTVGGPEVHSEFWQALFPTRYEALESLTVVESWGDRHQLTSLDQLDVPNLKRLAVMKPLSRNEVHGLTKLPLPQLEHLDLQRTGISSTALKSLSDFGAFENLKSLNLADGSLPLTASRILFQGNNLQACESLNMRNAFQTDVESKEFVDRLGKHSNLGMLKELHITKLTSSDLRKLTGCERLNNLQYLNVDRCQIDPKAASEISSTWRETLRKLTLNGLKMKPNAMSELCVAEFPKLTSLDLSDTYDQHGRVEEAGAVHIMESGAFPNLRELALDELRLTAVTLNALLENEAFPKLRKFSFQHNRATQDAVIAVLNSPHLRRLRLFDVSRTTGMKNRPKLVKEFGQRIKT